MTDTTTRPPRNPHAPYIAAVVDAFPANIAPAEDFVDDQETGEDGRTCTLTAILSWDDEASPDLYPHGLILCWSLEREWQYAALRDRHGVSDWPDDLPLSLWAAPEDVVAVVRALLAGEEPPTAERAEWHDETVIAAVREWAAS